MSPQYSVKFWISPDGEIVINDTARYAPPSSSDTFEIVINWPNLSSEGSAITF